VFNRDKKLSVSLFFVRRFTVKTKTLKLNTPIEYAVASPSSEMHSLTSPGDQECHARCVKMNNFKSNSGGHRMAPHPALKKAIKWR
jgi:hypothetical protein